MSGGDGSPTKIARHHTTTLADVLSSTCPGYAHEDMLWLPDQTSCVTAIGRPWRCTECRSKSCCCNYQAFDCISYLDAIAPRHRFNKPIYVKTAGHAALEGKLNVAFDAALDKGEDPAEDLLD